MRCGRTFVTGIALKRERHLGQWYGTSAISADTISRVTDIVGEEIAARQSR